MKYYLLLSFVLSIATAFASSLDKLSHESIQKMPMEKLEAIYLKENCPNKACDFRDYESQNLEKLSLAERLAVWRYTTWGYETINPALYNGKLSGAQVGFVRIVDGALKKIASQRVTVYRGTSKHAPQALNSVMELKGYTSTTPDRETAVGFVRDRLMVIETRSGKDIQDFSQSGQEREFLLPRGVKLKVIKVENKKMQIDPDGKPILVEVLTLKEI